MKDVSRPWAKFQIFILQSKPVLITRVESAVTANTRPVLAPVRSFRSLPVVLSHIYHQSSSFAPTRLPSVILLQILK
jgi:hypothetical protein